LHSLYGFIDLGIRFSSKYLDAGHFLQEFRNTSSHFSSPFQSLNAIVQKAKIPIAKEFAILPGMTSPY